VDTDAFNGTTADLQAWIAGYATPAPQAYGAAANTSMTALAKQHARTVPEVIWLTAHNRLQGFGLGETAYIAAGNLDASMPVGMTVWA
jgi:hypothetical protein